LCGRRISSRAVSKKRSWPRPAPIGLFWAGATSGRLGGCVVGVL
jgi:hypothetical protein